MLRHFSAQRLKRFFLYSLAVVCSSVSLAWSADPDASPVPADPQKFHLFLLAGQSNMAGRGVVSEADKKPNPRILMLNKDRQWVPAVDPLHFDKPTIAGVGVGRSFAAEYAKAHPGVTVGLIPCAVGGSGIETWQPEGFHKQTNSHPWDDMLVRATAAVEQGDLKGILWHQGESDSKPTAAAKYEGRLIELIGRFRETFQNPRLPFLIGQLGKFEERPWTEGRIQVDTAQQNVTRLVPRTAFVPADGLNHKGDQVHFDSPSLREFGYRYAAAMKWIESLEPVLTLAPSEGNPRNSEGDLIQLADGRVLHVYSRFESDASDHGSATLVSRYSDDGGATWSTEDELVVANEGGMNVMSVSLLRLADDRIALFYLVKNSLTDCRPVVRFSSDEAKTWTEPVQMIPDAEVGYYVLNNDRVIQLSAGRLVAPVALHHRPGQEKPDWLGQVTCYTSDDAGATWQRSDTFQKASDAEGNRVAAQEPGVVERRDGSLLMWVRTDAGVQYQATSTDRGATWTTLKPSALVSPRSPASIERIPATGDLIAIWNDHGFMDSPSPNRTPLALAISSDDGKTWSDSIPLDSDPMGWYCYTSIDFVDGSVLLSHVAGRRAKGEHLSTSVVRRLPLSEIYKQLHAFKIKKLQRIGDKKFHNAFTDLVLFKDKWYCVYREGTAHVSPDGALQILTSDDAKTWTSAAVITHPTADLRDAKMTVTPEGELMLSGAGAFPPETGVRHQSIAWFSKDGKTWSEGQDIGPANYWLWRTTFAGDNAYAIGYHTGVPVDKHISLFRSQDGGRTFQTHVDRMFEAGYPNETSILFQADGQAICLLRRDGDSKSGMLGKSMPPYDQWEWIDMGTRVGGPHILQLPDGRIVAAVRLYDGRVRTSLCWLNPETGALTEFQTLPSGGDTSYPGLVWHNDSLWVSYYSAHEVGNKKFKTAVYIAEVKE
ncbi:Carbohydrate acetyl esterase/feruloyl esterase precursor [Roseimaritima multifibrata]|uniref:Carbohydrate acetyl esterase/feruloyl esterase n=1 Tax=Roseimaritima multifibrata TaxID=1930274 RepID=A0A517MKB4_9BACT|nr:Carbohydrate acetyl esterase/feruloyl esterase precursor [Roseimaritima multifibrata]